MKDFEGYKRVVLSEFESHNSDRESANPMHFLIYSIIQDIKLGGFEYTNAVLDLMNLFKPGGFGYYDFNPDDHTQKPISPIYFSVDLITSSYQKALDELKKTLT